MAPGEVGYVEAHGTGTALGDPIEVNALGAVLSPGRSPDRPCEIGSVKSNIGHTEAAAGVAGLIKVALMLHHRATPPTLHCSDPNPRIPFDALPAPTVAGIPAVAGRRAGRRRGQLVRIRGDECPHPAGIGPAQAAGRGRRLPSFGASHPPLGPDPGGPARPGPRRCATGWRGRAAPGCATWPTRRPSAGTTTTTDSPIVASTPGGVIEALDAFLEGRTFAGLAAGRGVPGRRPGLVFVFSGQGGLWPGAGRELLDQEPAFRAVYDECDRWLGAAEGRSLVEELTAGFEAERLLDPAFAQPHQFALQVALAALWRSWGILPEAIVGHSLGEVAAAHVAGALSLADALRIACLRGRLMGRAVGLGKTAAVGLSAEEVRGETGRRRRGRPLPSRP